MKMFIGGCCCSECVATVGFWGTVNQGVWQSGIDFPAAWPRMTSRTKDNLTDVDILVVGRYSFVSPWADSPTTTAERDAVADWVTAGGVLFVIDEYYGTPSAVPSTPTDDIIDFLAHLGAECVPVATVGPAPTEATNPFGTFTVTPVTTHSLMAGVDKLYCSAPAHLDVNLSTLLFEARRNSGTPYVPVVTTEEYGDGHIIMLGDFSMLNTLAAANAIASNGNKINTLLANLCELTK